jgi:putative holliday junction resolvase|uniref:Holliday junction resolvase RuvX n=1 Tax=Candidatus Planktophila sp. TaxID=2175601 RepID=UPI00404AB8E7
MLRGRRLAFDYGDVRVGVAVCDPDGILATPVATLKLKDSNFWDQIIALIEEYEPVHIYVGSPKHLSGQSGTSVEKAEAFKNEIAERTSIDCTMIDERLSTVSAAKQLKDSGMNSRESKSAIDQAAAVAILEQALAIEKRKSLNEKE